jgi:hypothetical protein
VQKCGIRKWTVGKFLSGKEQCDIQPFNENTHFSFWAEETEASFYSMSSHPGMKFGTQGRS